MFIYKVTFHVLGKVNHDIWLWELENPLHYNLKNECVAWINHLLCYWANLFSELIVTEEVYLGMLQNFSLPWISHF